MYKPIRLIWKCDKCNDVVVSHSHIVDEMNYCQCGESAVYFQNNFLRTIGNITTISRKVNSNGTWVDLK